MLQNIVIGWIVVACLISIGFVAGALWATRTWGDDDSDWWDY